MALILPGAGVADIRGSVNGTTFARNRSGNYIRGRTVPVNPNTTLQSAVRGILAGLAVAWREELSAVQRTAWETYAAGTNWLNALGQTIKLTGLNHYVRCNVPRMQNGTARLDTAPITPGIPATPTLWTPTGTVDDQVISIAFTFTPNVNGSYYYFYQGLPMSQGRTFFKGPWRFCGSIVGNSSTPPASPSTQNASFPMSVETLVPIYATYADGEGRLSTPTQKQFLPAAT